MPSPAIPTSVRSSAREAWGDDGVRWLERLPATLTTVLRQWQLTPSAAMPMSLHYVIAVTTADGGWAVLKLGPPEPGHLADEAQALAHFAGEGAVRVLAHDPDLGALLLERAHPGSMARHLVPDRDSEATAAAVQLLRRLHRPPPPGCTLPLLEEEAESFADHLRAHDNGLLERRLVQQAGRLLNELCDTDTERVVLHGDLHHDNVLRATRQPWLAIDPHGVVGPPAYDIGSWLFNPDPHRVDDSLHGLVPRRLDQLADGLSMPRDQLVAWGFVKAVLSCVWSVQGGAQPAHRALGVARFLSPQLP